MSVKFEMTDAELKLLFNGHVDVFSEVQDRMALDATQVQAYYQQASLTSSTQTDRQTDRQT